MKKIIVKRENHQKNFSDNLKDFNLFKKEWGDLEKVFTSKLFNFSNFEKKKKNLKLALDFRDIQEFEIPKIENLKEVEYIFINKDTCKKELLKSKKKLIYSFEKFSFENEKKIKKELEDILIKENFESELKFNKFLKNLFFEIPAKSFEEDELFKIVVFIRKIFINLTNSKKIKILLKNNFNQEENQKILESKILKIDGVILN